MFHFLSRLLLVFCSWLVLFIASALATAQIFISFDLRGAVPFFLTATGIATGGLLLATAITLASTRTD